MLLIYDDEDNQIASYGIQILNGEAQEIVISNLEYDIQANLTDFESDSKLCDAKEI